MNKEPYLFYRRQQILTLGRIEICVELHQNDHWGLLVLRLLGF